MTNLGQITTITTGLPPMIDGVGDYSYHLAQQIKADFGSQTRFIVGNPRWHSEDSLEFWVERVEQRSARALLKLLEDSETILLHYVGYGYARRGSPTWLVQALQQWRNANPQGRLVTMFHEVSAYDPNLLSSQFWTAPLQRYLAQQLIQLSDHCLTSKQGYAKRIMGLSQGKHVAVPSIPVFSNVGEPKETELRPLAARPPCLVVFGGGGPRTRVYQNSWSILERTCRALEIEKIIDIGPPLPFELPAIANVNFQALGIQPVREISQRLREARVGFFDYSLPFLAKSTIFAAYCAHGVLPVGVFYPGAAEDGLEIGCHYCLGNNELPDLSQAQDIANNAYQWYESHSLPQQAKIFQQTLFQA